MKKSLGIILVLMLMASLLAGCKVNPTTSPKPTDKPSGQVQNHLPKFKDLAQLKALLKERQKNSGLHDDIKSRGLFWGFSGAKEAPIATAPSDSYTLGKNSDYSKTNVQVNGVDEADIVKTDGKYIYCISFEKQKVFIVAVDKDGKMSIANTIDYQKDAEGFQPSDMYVYDNTLVLLGSAYIMRGEPASSPVPSPDVTEKPQATANDTVDSPNIPPFMGKPALMPEYIGEQSTVALEYALDTKPEMKRKIVLDGNLVTSRMIDNAVYIVTNRYPFGIMYDYAYYGTPTLEARVIKDEDLLPKYQDSQSGAAGYATVPASEIGYAPDTQDTNMMMVGSFLVNSPDNKLQVETIMGAGTTVYMSLNSLYVAGYSQVLVSPEREKKSWWPGLGSANVEVIPAVYDEFTPIYQFAVQKGKVDFTGSSKINGRILNQYSMDEYQGNLRIAMTQGNTWDGTSQSIVTVLDQNLKPLGSVDNLGKTEEIKSVRFMGDKAYVVTFRQTDPLFVVDLNDPQNPKLLGELKVPGYSAYLHPWGQDKLIGFGMDADENGRTKGLKIAMFDVSDPIHPKQLFSKELGDRGSYSEIMNNPKSLIVDEQKGLIGFQASLAEEYVSTFNGLLVLNVDGEKDTFTEIGRVEHKYKVQVVNNPYNGKTKGLQHDKVPTASSSPDQSQPAGETVTQEITVGLRGIIVGDQLYAISFGRITSHALSNMKQIDKIELE